MSNYSFKRVSLKGLEMFSKEVIVYLGQTYQRHLKS